jgi:hypothetical protein
VLEVSRPVAVLSSADASGPMPPLLCALAGLAAEAGREKGAEWIARDGGLPPGCCCCMLTYAPCAADAETILREPRPDVVTGAVPARDGVPLLGAFSPTLHVEAPSLSKLAADPESGQGPPPPPLGREELAADEDGKTESDGSAGVLLDRGGACELELRASQRDVLRPLPALRTLVSSSSQELPLRTDRTTARGAGAAGTLAAAERKSLSRPSDG